MREAAAREAAAAAEMGFALEPLPRRPEPPMPLLPAVFQEQHPFNAGRAAPVRPPPPGGAGGRR